MNAQAIMERARMLGVTLTVAGDRIRYAPKSGTPAEFVEQLREHKSELLAYLAAAERPPAAADHADCQERLLARLRNGQQWLTEVHLKLLKEREVYEGMETKFLEALEVWQGLEGLLRGVYGYPCCVMGPGRRCREEAVMICRACVQPGKPERQS